ncbi:hypothetical protein ASZ90_017567 [hydrocarbon metagenome]|uniref:Replication-relaxation n=1 Tax=hydrocarbon metagenome TaxID=938273 RepID=A0A0W8E9J4_9ZZZZ
MARTWSKQEGDLKMLEALYRHKFLRGKVLTKISGYEERKGHDRISALKRQGLIATEPLVRPDRIGKRVVNKKVAAIYYLTLKGVATTKKLIYEEQMNGSERSRKPNDDEKERAYRVSLLMENLIDMYDSFGSPTGFKALQGIPNFIAMDLVYGNNLIFFGKSGPNMKQKITTECHALQERINAINTLILTADERRRTNFVDYSIEHYGQTERILAQDDYMGIRYLLDSNQDFKNLFVNKEIQIEELEKPYDGCYYIIDGELANIYDVVGMPPKILRRVKRTNGKVYLLVSNDKERKTLYKHYPEYQDNENIVVYEVGREILLNPNTFTLIEEPLQGDDQWANALQDFAYQNTRGDDVSL